MNNSQTIINQIKNVKIASQKIKFINNNTKNKILLNIAKKLEQNIENILKQNKIDILNAKRIALTSSLIDRLTLNQNRIYSMINSLKKITKIDDPTNKILETKITKNGLKILKIREPLGVIWIIYESRPNVTIDTIAIAIKSGNAIILKGGKEAINSNTILSNIAIEAAKEINYPENAIFFLDTSNKKIISEILQQDKLIDVIIPRGSQKMIEKISKISKIPIIKHGKGLCHIFVDEFANIDMAIKIIKNAKLSRPGVCNSIENILLHKNIAENFLINFLSNLEKNKIFDLTLKVCDDTMNILKNINISNNIKNNILKATDIDWDTEYLDKILSIKIINSINEAIEFINIHGTGHSESIITENKDNAENFLKNIDAAAVYHNTSTRFTDGGCFGIGAELGISTQKLHARGPMGINELTSYKFIIYGNGQIRE